MQSTVNRPLAFWLTTHWRVGDNMAVEEHCPAAPARTENPRLPLLCDVCLTPWNLLRHNGKKSYITDGYRCLSATMCIVVYAVGPRNSRQEEFVLTHVIVRSTSTILCLHKC
jgi:hypothetical protein